MKIRLPVSIRGERYPVAVLRVAALLAVLLAALGCGAGAATTATTELKISYWSQGRAVGVPQKWTLRCAPAGGTLPRPGIACQKLLGMPSPFAPLRKDLVCTEQYGGPQVAVISGTFKGNRVWVQLQNRNGCEISRFKRLAFLVPTFSSGADA
jgi:hypothetical protein